MIGRLTGTLLEKQPPMIAVDVQGVAYELDVPMSTFYQLPVAGSTTTLFTHLLVRDDAHLLYGFATKEERQLFRQLLKVNGVGDSRCISIDLDPFPVVARGDRVEHAAVGIRRTVNANSIRCVTRRDAGLDQHVRD